MPVAMIIDVLNKVLLVHLSRVNMHESYCEALFSMTFIDVTEQTGAKRHPQSQLTQIDRFPVFFGNSYLILETPAIYFIQSDGNYCIVHTENRTYHLLMTLKSILDRYAGTKFVMVHKSYLVNLDHVHGIQRQQNRTMVIFDSNHVPAVPVARRRIKALKAALGFDDRLSYPVYRSSKNC
jgi:DNA-binding LytR/AlgR family response regulator